MASATALSFANDETTGADRNAHSQTWVKFPDGEESFVVLTRLRRDQLACVAFTAKCGLVLPDNSEHKTKSGLNTARMMLDDLGNKYPSLTASKMSGGSTDGTGSNTSETIGLQVVTTAACRSLGSRFDMMWTICLPHCLSLGLKDGYDGTPYLHEKFLDALPAVWQEFAYSAVKKGDLNDIMVDILGLKKVDILKATLIRWLSTYPAVVNLKKALHAVLLQFETAKVPSQNAADHASTSATLHSFNFCTTVYFLADILRPLHQRHAQLQSPRLILQEVESHYINARNHMQHFLDDGCTEETTPNFLQFVQEVVEGKIDEKIISKLKPNVDTAENRAERLGDLVRVYISTVANVFVLRIVANLDRYFEASNFAVQERLERVVIPTIVHTLNAIADFGIVSGLLTKEKASESQAWTTDLEQFADDTNMEETLVGSLKAERRAWRDGLILLRLTAMKKNMEVFCDASTLLSAVETHGQLKLDCPHHFHLLEVLTTSMFTSVSPERGFSWLKRFLTRVSQVMGAVHLDNCMQVAMNARG
jgi:hypothetical protein